MHLASEYLRITDLYDPHSSLSYTILMGKFIDGKVEPILLFLILLMIFFTGALFLAEWRFGNDGQMFQVVSNVLSAVAGAFIMRVKPSSGTPNPPNVDFSHAGNTTVTTKVEETKAESK